MRYIRKAVTSTQKKGSFPKKPSCFSALKQVLLSSIVVYVNVPTQSFSQSADSLMVRSCSIPESLACEWEADTSLYQTSSCRLYISQDSSDYRLNSPQDRCQHSQHQLMHTFSFYRIQNSPIKTKNCRTDFCVAKFGTLKTELEVAQAQIRSLEHQLVDHGIDIRYAGYTIFFASKNIAAKGSNTGKDDFVVYLAYLNSIKIGIVSKNLL